MGKFAIMWESNWNRCISTLNGPICQNLIVFRPLCHMGTRVHSGEIGTMKILCRKRAPGSQRQYWYSVIGRRRLWEKIWSVYQEQSVGIAIKAVIDRDHLFHVMKSDQNFDAWLIQCHMMTRRLWVSHCAWSIDLNSRKGVLPGRQLFANWETVTPPSSCCTLSPCCCTRLRAFSKWPIWSPCTWCIAHWAPDWLHPVASLCLSRRRFQLGRSEQRKSRASPASNFLLRYSVVWLHVCQDFVHHLVFW